jgi:hypothetical protein
MEVRNPSPSIDRQSAKSLSMPNVIDPVVTDQALRNQA